MFILMVLISMAFPIGVFGLSAMYVEEKNYSYAVFYFGLGLVITHLMLSPHGQ